MNEEYDFSKGKRGAVVPALPGKTRITIRLDNDILEWFREAVNTLGGGNYQTLITTGQFFGEGTDLQNASCLFLVYPFSFKGKLIQYIGRVQRSENTPVIYDYHDYQIDYLNKLFLKRNLYYRKFARQASLFDEQEIIKASS
jgi:superfamily II DNA or RNA helicase